MKKGIYGKKLGMTQIFDENGLVIPVTVVEVEPCVVVTKKTVETDGYNAIQIATGEVKEKNMNKPLKGIFDKAGIAYKKYIKELRVDNVDDYNVGDEIKADIFAAGELVDVQGVSKGKGFQGVIKRYNQTRGPMGHGSQYHRGVGSLGTLLPMHVLKGKKMPGQMGNVQRTVQNLEVISVDAENNVILVKGNVPGPKKSFVMIRTAVKKPNVKLAAADLITYAAPVTVEEVVEETVTEENTETSAE